MQYARKKKALVGISETFRKISGGFTLVELIVVITILAILATVGFLSLSGYSDDARSSVTKANVRMVYTAIATESATSGNSPRYYIEHDSAAALAGKITFGGMTVVLTGGAWNVPGTNYSAGNPRWDLLRLNPDKFRVSSAFGGYAEPAFAAYDSGAVTVGAVDASIQPTASGKKRTASVFQVAAASPASKKISTMGNYSPTSDTDLSGLVKDTASTLAFASMVEGGTVGVFSGGGGSQYPGCDTPDIILSNGQVWAACNVGASNAWTWAVSLPNCGGGVSDCLSAYRWSVGSYFQWGRNNDVTATATTTTLAPTGTLAGSVGHSNFILGSGSTTDWMATPNAGLWGGASTGPGVGVYADRTAAEQSAMSGPCAPGYHVPTIYEWAKAIAAITPTANNIYSNWQNDSQVAVTLKLPFAGTRQSDGKYSSQGQCGYYWASSQWSTNYGYFIWFISGQLAGSANPRSVWYSVRCLAN